MKVGILLKSVAAALLWKSGRLRRKLESFGRERSGILMYHRVLPARFPKNGMQPGMYVNVNTFDQHIRYLKGHFSLVSLEDIMTFDTENQPVTRPLCCLTFDDGWHDFYLHVFPILKAHQVPATVFLPTDYIGGGRTFWTDRLGFLLHYGLITSEKSIQPGHLLAQKILTLSGRSEARLEAAVSCLKGCTDEAIELVLQELAACLECKHKQDGRAFLDWKEIREMADSGLVRFGSHTVNHRILTTLNDEEIQVELNKSRNTLLAEKIVSEDFIPFCYPNGNFNESIVKAVAEAGYSLAVTTESGWNGKDADLHALKRIPVHEDMTSTNALFACRLAGIF